MIATRALAIVIPARNEAALIGSCLDALRLAMHRLDDASVRLTATVVADGCSDGTVEIAERFEFVQVLATPAIGVGAARHLGVQHALRAAEYPTDQVWIATTDADSRVDEDWLVNQLAAANSGAGLRIGAVRPDFDDLSAVQLEAWTASHAGGVARGHVHGANLGIRASLYQEIGGFRPIDLHEDVDLVRRATRGGAVSISAAEPDVTTSGRSVARAHGGYAAYLNGELLRAVNAIG